MTRTCAKASQPTAADLGPPIAAEEGEGASKETSHRVAVHGDDRELAQK